MPIAREAWRPPTRAERGQASGAARLIGKEAV
jgi:hypothetical protein